MDDTPVWVPLMFGGVMFLMGAVILGALFGIVPIGDGQWLAPPLVILSLGGGLALGGVMMTLLSSLEGFPWLRSLLFLIVMGLVAVVCNWSAFAPDVVYDSSSSISIGPLAYSSDGGSGGARIVFGIAAVLVDGFMLYLIIAWIREKV